jgi:hypothetical protein
MATFTPTNQLKNKKNLAVVDLLVPDFIFYKVEEFMKDHIKQKKKQKPLYKTIQTCQILLRMK